MNTFQLDNNGMLQILYLLLLGLLYQMGILGKKLNQEYRYIAQSDKNSIQQAQMHYQKFLKDMECKKETQLMNNIQFHKLNMNLKQREKKSLLDMEYKSQSLVGNKIQHYKEHNRLN